MNVSIVFLVFAVTLILGLPIGVSIMLSSLTAVLANPVLPMNTEFIVRSMVTGLDVFALLAVPLFILSGIIMARGGISKKIFDFFAYFIGNKTAGLLMATIATCLFYGAISGSGPATCAAVGAMTIPILVRLGYNKDFVTSMVAVAGGLGVIIPPSIPFVMYGLASGESVGALFIAGVVPGLLIGGLLMLYAYIYCKKHGEDKEKLQKNFEELHKSGFKPLLRDSFWALLTPVIVLGGIYGGFTTPTEAACISVVYSLIIGLFVYKTLTIKDLLPIFREAINTFVPIMFVVASAVAFGRVLTMMQIPQMVAGFMIRTFKTKVVMLLVINVFLLFVGMIMDTNPAILILAPIFLPIVKELGVDPIHFGVVMVVNLAIGFVTPPVGVNLYVASGMTGIPILRIAKKAIPFILVFILALLIITFVPQVSLLLVK